MKIIRITGLLFLIGISLYIITVPIHEAVHYILLVIEPEARPLEYHALDYESFSEGRLGFVTWAGNEKLFNDFTHELLAWIVQYTIMFTIACTVMPHLIRVMIRKEWLCLEKIDDKKLKE